ncbi:MAG: DUF3999 family protein, partial [Rhodanobacteraceae bacterium]|nr:DUF3999 family protein [Rhodanobacteraceae bacterium]
MRWPVCLIASIATSAWANTPADYAARIPIQADNSSAAWQITLNEEVYRWSQDDRLRDVVIFNAEGRPVPLARWQQAPGEHIERQQSELPAFELPEPPTQGQAGDWNLVIERDGSGRVRRIQTRDDASSAEPEASRDWLLDASAFDKGIDSLTLDWSDPHDGVVARFRVEGSDDLQTWRSLSEGAVVVRLQRDGVPVERRDIDLPGLKNRYLRLVRLDAGEALREMTAVARSETRSRQSTDELRWLTPRSTASLAGVDASPTRHLYTLPGSIPVQRVRVRLANDNALADLELLSAEPSATNRTRWQSR